MSALVTVSVTADVADLGVSKGRGYLAIKLGQDVVFFPGPDDSATPKADALRVLAHLTELVRALPDDEVPT